jgi:hypothetical protein
MDPTSAVKVTATKKQAGRPVCAAVADKGLKKESTWINNNCELDFKLSPCSKCYTLSFG